MLEETNTEKKDVIKSTAETIVNYNVDTAIDYTEIGLDSLLDNPILKNFPVVKTVYGLAKTGFAIREKHTLKKLIIFIDKLNKNALSSEEYKKYKEKLKKNDKSVLKELEYVLIIIDRYIEIDKNKILANLYLNYIEKNINWNQFQELSIIVDNIFIADSNELENIYVKTTITMNEVVNKNSLRRLLTQNLIEEPETTRRISYNSNDCMVTYICDYDYKISQLGMNLCKFGLRI